MYMYDKGLHTFLQLLHLGIMHLCVVFVRCGKTLVIPDNRIWQRYIRILLFVCLLQTIKVKGKGQLKIRKIWNRKALMFRDGHA